MRQAAHLGGPGAKARRFKTIAGYFNNVVALVDALLARAANRTKNWMEQTLKDPAAPTSVAAECTPSP
ncbi:MAG: hypothetical protein ABR861_12705 [Terriglobales bacterium]